MKKKLLALALLAGILCTVLTACGGGSTEKPTEDRKSTNEIVVGIAQDLDDSLDPHKTVKAGTREVMFNVFEGLVKPAPNGDLIPAIAETYKVSEDHLTYTFTLREGVKYHNGEAVTAEDVVYSLSRCLSADDGVQEVAAFSNIAHMTAAPDGRTVEIKLLEPSNEFLSYLTVAVLPKDYAEQDTAPVGTGPFKFVSRAAQDNIVLEKFDEYWGTPARLDKVTLKIVENADSLMLSLQSGAIDLCGHLTNTQVAQLGDGFDVAVDTMKLVQALYLNNAVEPFDDIRVRQALCHAVDKQQILDLAFDGYGKLIGTSIYPDFGKYFDESLIDYYEYDVEKAKALLTEAGYPEGFSMTMTVPSNYKPHIDTAEVLVQQLAAVGITAEIQLVEWETWVSDVYAGRNFQTTVVGFDASTMTARALLERFTSTYSKNFINYNSPNYDALFAQAQACYDDAEQTQLYRAMERDLTENAANVYIQDLADLVAVRKGLTGLAFYPIYVLDLSTVRYEG